tara:strand:+ start:1664 stop:1858 length:195 start_codon:yes stop_codon:yes gene_type:complete
MTKKINKCSMCQESFKGQTSAGYVIRMPTAKHFKGMLGPIPVALHKKCFIKLNKYKILNLEDDK